MKYLQHQLMMYKMSCTKLWANCFGCMCHTLTVSSFQSKWVTGCCLTKRMITVKRPVKVGPSSDQKDDFMIMSMWLVDVEIGNCLLKYYPFLPHVVSSLLNQSQERPFPASYSNSFSAFFSLPPDTPQQMVGQCTRLAAVPYFPMWTLPVLAHGGMLGLCK